MKWHNFCMNCNCHSLSLNKSDSRNQIYTTGVNNDYISQNANIICYKYNIHLLLQWLESGHHRENMNLFARDMEPDIPSNENERISNYILCGNMFSFMNTMK